MLQADKLIKEAFLTANWFIEDRPSLNGCSSTNLPTSIYSWDGVVTGYFSWRSRYFVGCSWKTDWVSPDGFVAIFFVHHQADLTMDF